MSIFESFIFAIGFNLLMFLPAYFLKTDKLTDISYSLTFAVIAILGFLFSPMTTSGLILTFMLLLWASRLGGYLLIRIRKIGKDSRFDKRRENFWKFCKFWLLQGLTAWIVMLPSIMFFNNESKVIPLVAFVGVLFWLVGLAVETVADWQKFTFINNPENKNKWIEIGLWKYSRHPNYFGEILVWIGVYLFTFFGLSFVQAIFALISPLFIGILIIFVSGIPLLEKSADKKWGREKSYQRYKNRVSILVPLPRRDL